MIAGRMVRLTANGLLVIERHRAISFRRASGVGWVSAVSTPSAPALLTAEVSSAVPTHCIPPCIKGYLTPVLFVNSVSIVMFLFSVACILGNAERTNYLYSTYL